MGDLRALGNAMAVALLSIGLTLGALSISLVSFIPEEVPEPTQTAIVTPLPVTATHTLPPTLTPLVAQNTLTLAPTSTVVPPVSCQLPAGWVPIIVQIGETLDGLAFKYNTTRDALKTGNCLFSETLLPGTTIHVPRIAATNIVAVCSQGAVGWIRNYEVKSGDTFFNIGSRYGVTSNTVKLVNCRTSDLIVVGEILWVPNQPTRTPTFTALPGVTFTAITPLLTDPVTETVLPFTQTFVPTQTPIPATPTATPSVTPIPTLTASPTAFPTSTP
jgi:LysM repeat protein